MTPAVRAAVDGVRPWALLMTGEIALVVPLRGDQAELPVIVAAGTRDAVTLSPAKVLRVVLASRADAFVLVHTHPEDVPPGPSDLAVTKRLVAASALLGVRMLGHAVVAPTATYDCFAA